MRLVLLLLAALIASCELSQECPCGQSYEHDVWDPYGEPLGIGREHPESLHCFCRCGEDGELERLPPSRTCDAYDGLCTNAFGETDRYRCE